MVDVGAWVGFPNSPDEGQMISEQMFLISHHQVLNRYQEAALSMLQVMGQRTRGRFCPQTAYRLVREKLH